MKKKLKCVLLIDDDNDCNYYHKRLFAKIDCAEQVIIVNDGRQALDFLSTPVDGKFPAPEIVFLDINMPRLNGWEFLEEYKKLGDDVKAKVVLVMLTSSLNPDDRQRAENFDDVHGFKTKYLNKTVVETILLEHFPDYF